MKQSIWWLFVIPILAIIIIATHQFWDEMFKKKFIIERRSGRANGSPADRRRRSNDPEGRNRRYNDPVDPNAPPAAATPDSDKAQPSLEPSGLSN
jgi:hypothetical protein